MEREIQESKWVAFRIANDSIEFFVVLFMVLFLMLGCNLCEECD
jgi:hypothetical protein